MAEIFKGDDTRMDLGLVYPESNLVVSYYSKNTEKTYEDYVNMIFIFSVIFSSAGGVT